MKTSFILLGLFLFAPGAARAQMTLDLTDPPPPAAPAKVEQPLVQAPAPQPVMKTSGPTLLLNVGVGGLFPGVFNKLNTSYALQLGGGWVVPALNHRLAVVADAGYTGPQLTARLPDDRVGGSSYSYRMLQEDLRAFVGGQWHFADLTEARFVPYGALGLQVHMRRTIVQGTAGGQALGTNEETGTGVGGALRGGLGMRLGPGLATAQVEADLAPINATITGDKNESALSATLGYMLVL